MREAKSFGLLVMQCVETTKEIKFFLGYVNFTVKNVNRDLEERFNAVNKHPNL